MKFNGYHFTGDRLRDGRPVPAIGETLRHEGEIVWCGSGLYASPTAYHAFQYALGPHLHRVWCEEIELCDPEKFACRSRTIVASINVMGLLPDFTRQCALDLIQLWDAPEVVRRYLETGDEKLRAAAREASWNAFYVLNATPSPWDAFSPQDVAWVTAQATAPVDGLDPVAAWDVTRAAARSTAWAATHGNPSTRFNAMIDAAFEAQEGSNND